MKKLLKGLGIVAAVKVGFDILSYGFIKAYWARKGCKTDTIGYVVDYCYKEVKLEDTPNRFVKLLTKYRKFEYGNSYKLMLKLLKKFTKFK